MRRLSDVKITFEVAVTDDGSQTIDWQAIAREKEGDPAWVPLDSQLGQILLAHGIDPRTAKIKKVEENGPATMQVIVSAIGYGLPGGDDAQTAIW